MPSDLEFDIDDLIIKSGTCFDYQIIVVKIQLVKKVKFLILHYQDTDLVLLTTCDLYAVSQTFTFLKNKNFQTSVVDFLFVELSEENKEITLWAISRESFDDEKQLDTMFQPYLLRHCVVDL